MQQLSFQKNIQWIFILSKLLNSPLGVMYGLLSFILCKNFHASPLQITLLISSKPIVAIISFYSLLLIKNRPDRLKFLILLSTFVGFVPCFLFPFLESSWFYIFSFALFMMAARAMLPAWTEIFKLNVSDEERGKVFARGSTVNYLANIFIPLIVAPLMDAYPGSWKWIFFSLACLQVLHLFLLSQLKVNFSSVVFSEETEREVLSFQSVVWGPWKKGWALMRERADFRHYQVVFLFGGAGLILAQPVLPVFFEEVLHLSYTQLAFATSLCKGLGFALTSPIWARWFNRLSIHAFNFHVTVAAGLFALILVFMGEQVSWIYIAYFIYGLMQAGSELSWHLAGPKFSQKEDSTLFTGVNVMMVGLRGCVAPFLGELLFLASNSTTVFFVSALLCLTGAVYSLSLTLRLETVQDSS